MRRLLFSVICIFNFANIFAQKIPLTQLNFEDGLTRGSFYEVAKDPQGYLWLASETSIIRYDGNEFKQYTARDGFKGNFVLDIDFDQQGYMWISTYGGGMARFDGERFHPFNKENGFPGNYIRSAIQGSDGDVWVAAEDMGPIRIQKGKKPELINDRLKTPILNPWSCMEDTEGNIWFVAIGGVYKFIKAKNYAYQWVYSTQYTFTSILQDDNGTIWAGGAYTFLKIEKDSIIDLTSTLPANSIILDMHIGKEDKKIYIATTDRLIVKDGDSLSFLDKKNGVANAQFWDIYEDDVNEFWLSSAGGGIVKYDNHGINWYGDAEGLHSLSSLQDIVEDKQGRIIFGTELDGYWYFEQGQFRKFDHPEFANVRTGYGTIYDSLYNITVCLSANGSVMWMRDDKVIGHYQSSRAGGITGYGLALIDSNDLMMATDIGCFILSRQSDKPRLVEAIPAQFFRTVFRDAQGFMWITADNGDIYRYKDGTAKNFQSILNPEKASVLSGSYDNYYQLYFFSTTSGLIIWDGKNRIKLHSGNGLVGDVPAGVVRDHQNQLWVGHDKGFTCINLEDSTMRHIGFDQGFRSVAVNFRSMLMSRSGILYAGAVNELYSINVKNLEPKNRHTRLRLQEVFFRDNIYFQENYFTDSLPELYLAHNEDNFQIDLAALDFINADKVKYSWMLKGFDQDFMPYSNLNEVIYTNLAPGDYEFIAKAIDSEGFATNEVHMKIHITKPFWERIWFYALEIGIFITIAVMSFAFSGKKSGSRFGQIMTFLTIIILFESMIFYLSNFINPFTNGIPVFQLVMNIILACILQPMERWVKRLMDKISKAPVKNE